MEQPFNLQFDALRNSGSGFRPTIGVSKMTTIPITNMVVGMSNQMSRLFGNKQSHTLPVEDAPATKKFKNADKNKKKSTNKANIESNEQEGFSFNYFNIKSDF